MTHVSRILQNIDALITSVVSEADRQVATWSQWDIRPEFLPSAKNLAAYLAFRHHDLRMLQRELMVLGLSSLGRLESRVLPTLQAVRSALSTMLGEQSTAIEADHGFFAGEECLRARAVRFFGARGQSRTAALLVTCPADAAEDPSFMLHLAQRGVEAIRINCAHDDPDTWHRMIENAHAAEARVGRRLRIFMDLAGPKIRTGQIRSMTGHKRVSSGDRIAVVPPGAADTPCRSPADFVVECTLPDALAAARPGHRMFIDDGKIMTTVERACDGVLTALVTRCKDDGAKLKPEKGLNFPDTALSIPALTAKDREDLRFIAAHADGIAFSFVQSPDDVALLQSELAAIQPAGWQKRSLILKIETAQAVQNLPDIIVRAGARQPVAIMIARGDLALEIGFTRLAEMQEEILWIGEAAQVPVIWATQVLEHLVKEGLPNRGELTDAAMAVRAECVMLNKGPFLFDAIEELDLLLGRMDDHLHKKTPQLRMLGSW